MSILFLALLLLSPPAAADDPREPAPVPTSLGLAFAPFPVIARSDEDPAVPEARATGAATRGAEDETFSENLYRRFSLSLGFAAFSGFDTAIEYGAGGLLSANLDLEDELDVEESIGIARLDGQYSFSRAHRLDFSYYDIRRDGTTTLLEDSQVGDILFPAGAAVSTELDTTIYKVSYRWNFVADPKTTIGASFGIHWMAIEFGMETVTGSLEETFRVDAPLPVLGLHWDYAFTPKWRLAIGAELLRFDVGEYRGVVNDTRLTIEHDTFEHFGWGIGLNAFALDGHFDDGDQELELEYGYQSVMVYLRTFF